MSLIKHFSGKQSGTGLFTPKEKPFSGHFMSRSSCGAAAERLYTAEDDTSPEPNRFRFSTTRVSTTLGYVVMYVHYPDCTTYDGYKTIVMNRAAYEDWGGKELDPHFIEGNGIIARFPGDEAGYQMAIKFVRSLP